MVWRIVLQPLRPEDGTIEPIRELYQPILPGGGRNGLVISHAEKNRKIAEWIQLMRDKIRPRGGQIGADEHRLWRQAELGGRHHIFLHGRDRAKHPQLTVKFPPAFLLS